MPFCHRLGAAVGPGGVVCSAPAASPIAANVPPWAGLTLLLLLVADSFFSVRLLRRTHNVDLLGIPNLLAALR